MLLDYVLIRISRFPDHFWFPLHQVCPGGGFGPVADAGYGVSYMLAGDYRIFFHVSSKHSSQGTDSTRFMQAIFESFAEMKALFDGPRDNWEISFRGTEGTYFSFFLIFWVLFTNMTLPFLGAFEEKLFQKIALMRCTAKYDLQWLKICITDSLWISHLFFCI